MTARDVAVIVDGPNRVVQTADDNVIVMVTGGPTISIATAGATGPPGPAGSGGGSGIVWPPVTTVSAPVTLVQILHSLPFNPAGIHCVDQAGIAVEWAAVTYPSLGIVEITFGFPFTGAIYIS